MQLLAKRYTGSADSIILYEGNNTFTVRFETDGPFAHHEKSVWLKILTRIMVLKNTIYREGFS